MKRRASILVFIVILSVLMAGCGATKANLTFDSKHESLPDYVLNSSKKVQETYIMASNYLEVIAQVPCFCECSTAGHKSNLDCFVKQIGSDNAVNVWDDHGIA